MPGSVARTPRSLGFAYDLPPFWVDLSVASLVQDLFYRYGGLASESPEYRKAAANRVGVTIPDKIPLREFDHSHYQRQ